METTEYSLPALISRAERYCATAEHCAADLKQKLHQWGCHEEDIELVLAHLYEQGYIDDARYARAFVHDQVAYQGWGRLKIRAALYSRFIDEKVVNAALDTIDSKAYDSALQKAAARKKGATREQLLRFLSQRGFTFDEIRRCIL